MPRSESRSLVRGALLTTVAVLAASGAQAKAAPSALVPVYVLLDDYAPQPRPAEPYWPFNRLGGTHGPIDVGVGQPIWGRGDVTATLTGDGIVGVFSSLNHPISENLALDFGAIFPPQIDARLQGRVSEVRVHVLDGSGTFKVELQDQADTFVWSGSQALAGGPQDLVFVLPPLGAIRNLNWIVEGTAGEFAVVDEVGLTLELPESALARANELWSLALLLANWTPGSGLVRDRASFPAGQFDNVSASGLLAAAVAAGSRQGLVPRASAEALVQATAAGMLALPTCHGLWPHFARNGQIAPDTEWSSLDSVIAVVGLIEAQQALGLDTSAAEGVLTGIDWAALEADGLASHGFDTACSSPLTQTWTDFGGESWLVAFGMAAGTGGTLRFDHVPPTANGSGFIDELAWLLLPPPSSDHWGTDWAGYRKQAAAHQVRYYAAHPCYGPAGLFGLSAAEVPHPADAPDDVYQAFGVGGVAPPNDGSALLGHAVVTPHYAGLAAGLRVRESKRLWRWLVKRGLFTPLNAVESLMFEDEPACQEVVWNDLRGSWNLALQSLGSNRARLKEKYPPHRAALANPLLSAAYAVMTEPSVAPLATPRQNRPD